MSTRRLSLTILFVAPLITAESPVHLEYQDSTADNGQTTLDTAGSGEYMETAEQVMFRPIFRHRQIEEERAERLRAKEHAKWNAAASANRRLAGPIFHVAAPESGFSTAFSSSSFPNGLSVPNNIFPSNGFAFPNHPFTQTGFVPQFPSQSVGVPVPVSNVPSSAVGVLPVNVRSSDSIQSPGSSEIDSSYISRPNIYRNTPLGVIYKEAHNRPIENPNYFNT